MDLMRRRREMMKIKPYWDHIFTPGANGYYSAIPVAVKAGQTVLIEFAPSTYSNGYIYYSSGGIVSPGYQRANNAALKQGGTLTIQIIKDGNVYFGTNNAGSTYYNFNGEYIKVHIE